MATREELTSAIKKLHAKKDRNAKEEKQLKILARAYKDGNFRGGGLGGRAR